MMAYWTKTGSEPPILLMNRDNAGAAATGEAAARARAVQKSTGGAVKLTDLAGALFRHKDDKKGQQDSARWFFENSSLGKVLTFPDTSNTRFGSHGDAATVLIAYLPLFCELLELIRDKKVDGQWNHLEANVYRGLHDIPTLTELAVLTIYSQTTGRPYMRAVRGPDNPNHLDLGPLHAQVLAHVKRLADNPDIVLDDHASQESGTLDGQPWDLVDAFNAVRKMRPILLHLRGALVEFLNGALVTWKRFAAEFAPGGVIAQLSDAEKQRAWRPATNDVNEGQLGSARVTLRQNPNMSLHQLNAQAMYKTNGTSRYMNLLSNDDRRYVRKAARELGEQGRERERRRRIAQAEKEEAAGRTQARESTDARKGARLDKLKMVVPVLELSALKWAKLTGLAVKDQLDWHREWVEGDEDLKHIPQAQYTRLKPAALVALRAAVIRYNADPNLRKNARKRLAAVGIEFQEGIHTCEEEQEEEDVADIGEERRGPTVRPQCGDGCSDVT